VDLGDIIVHVMQPAIRTYYNLEQLWGGRPPSPASDHLEERPGAERRRVVAFPRLKLHILSIGHKPPAWVVAGFEDYVGACRARRASNSPRSSPRPAAARRRRPGQPGKYSRRKKPASLLPSRPAV